MPPQKFYSDQICSLLKFNGILVGPLEYKNVKTPAIFTENESGTKKKLRRHSPPFTSLVVISCGWNKVTKGK